MNIMNKPRELSKAEIREICELDFVREGWGARSTEEMGEIFEDGLYAVKFAFVSGSPGYVGDLYILQGDALTGDPPLALVRDQQGQLISAY